MLQILADSMLVASGFYTPKYPVNDTPRRMSRIARLLGKGRKTELHLDV